MDFVRTRYDMKKFILNNNALNYSVKAFRLHKNFCRFYLE